MTIVKSLLAAGLLAVALVASGLAQQPTPQQRAASRPAATLPAKYSLRLSVVDYPRVDGSTSAHPLGVAIACAVTGYQCQWSNWSFRGGQRRLWPLPARAKTPAESAPKPQPPVKLDTLDAFAWAGVAIGPGSIIPANAELGLHTRHNGTHGSYVNLIQRKARMILVARRPSEDEVKLAGQRGVELAIREVALDAFVFLLNRNNKVAGLTTQQIRDIYTGKITNWKTVGGADKKINAYQRNRNSGSQETMKTAVMGDRKMSAWRPMITHSMNGPYNRLARDVAGMCYTFRYYNQYMAPMTLRTLRKRADLPAGWPSEPVAFDENQVLVRPTRMCVVDGAAPTPANIRNGKYPFVTGVYLVHLADMKADSPAARLRDWILSPEGQAVVTSTGYVPLPPDRIQPPQK